MILDKGLLFGHPYATGNHQHQHSLRFCQSSDILYIPVPSLAKLVRIAILNFLSSAYCFYRPIDWLQLKKKIIIQFPHARAFVYGE